MSAQPSPMADMLAAGLDDAVARASRTCIGCDAPIFFGLFENGRRVVRVCMNAVATKTGRFHINAWNGDTFYVVESKPHHHKRFAQRRCKDLR